jgi:hypothetical protein
MDSSLSIDVLASGYQPVPAGPGWDDSAPAPWSASTSTLISGDRDAVLVDALLTTGQGERLAVSALLAQVHGLGPVVCTGLVAGALGQRRFLQHLVTGSQPGHRPWCASTSRKMLCLPVIV